MIWRIRFCFWCWWWLLGSGIPLGVIWNWSDDAEQYTDQSPWEAAMDTVNHLSQP